MQLRDDKKTAFGAVFCEDRDFARMGEQLKMVYEDVPSSLESQDMDLVKEAWERISAMTGELSTELCNRLLEIVLSLEVLSQEAPKEILVILQNTLLGVLDAQGRQYLQLDYKLFSQAFEFFKGYDEKNISGQVRSGC